MLKSTSAKRCKNSAKIGFRRAGNDDARKEFQAEAFIETDRGEWF
jgi:hypothetical protein